MMNTPNTFFNDKVDAPALPSNKPRRILPDKALKKIDAAHSYVTYFLAGSFIGLAVGGTLDQFDYLPSFIVNTFDLHTLSIVIGSVIALACKVFIFSK